MRNLVDPGVYECYDGQTYDVLGVGKTVKTNEPLVIAQHGSKWRLIPYLFFKGTTKINSHTVDNFIKAGE